MDIHQHKVWVAAREVVPEVFRRVMWHNVSPSLHLNLFKHFRDIGAGQHQSRLCDERIQRRIEGQHLTAGMYFRHMNDLDLAMGIAKPATSANVRSWPILVSQKVSTHTLPTVPFRASDERPDLAEVCLTK
jgi:hypothetical protein